MCLLMNNKINQNEGRLSFLDHYKHYSTFLLSTGEIGNHIGLCAQNLCITPIILRNHGTGTFMCDLKNNSFPSMNIYSCHGHI